MTLLPSALRFTSLAMAIAPVVAQDPVIQVDWVQSPVNGRYYGVEFSGRSWGDSESAAMLLGGHLATIQSQAEQDWMSSTFLGLSINSGSAGASFWLGASDELQEGVWAWSDNSPFSYSGWGAGQPSNQSSENYATMADASWNLLSPGDWNDDSAPQLYRSLIELAGPPTHGWSWPMIADAGTSSQGWTSSEAADMDGDGDIDLVAGRSDGALVLYWNDGAGGLTAGATLQLPNGVNDVVSIDHDQDGDLDLLACDYWGETLRLFTNTGGVFSPTTLLTGGRFVTIELADLNGDGLEDAVITDALGHGVRLIMGMPGGGFDTTLFVPVGFHPWYSQALDWDADGDLDLVVASNGNSGSGGIYSLLNDGQWTTVMSLPATEPRRFGVVDLASDGSLDLVVGHECLGEIRTYRGDNAGHFTLDQVIAVGGPAGGIVFASGLKLAELDTDAEPEVVLRSTGQGSGVRIFEINADGTLDPVHGVLHTQVTYAVSVADFDGDLVPDISALDVSGDIKIWLNHEISDCNGNGIPDTSDITGGMSLDCNANAIPDECEADCDLNGIPDDCDINSQPSADCDLNGLLDSCQIAANPSLDQNLNGVLDTCECLATNYCLASGNSSGPPSSIGHQGSLSLSNNDFVLTAVSAPPFKFGVFFYSAAQTQVFLGEGQLCVGPTVQRLQPLVLTNQDGSASLPLDFAQPPFSTGPFAIAPLSTWNFQFWYRDPLGGLAGFNFSDGLEVTFCP